KRPLVVDIARDSKSDAPGEPHVPGCLCVEQDSHDTLGFKGELEALNIAEGVGPEEFLHESRSLPPPNGSRLSCGRLARWRKGVGRQSVPARAQHSASTRAISARQLQALVRPHDYNGRAASGELLTGPTPTTSLVTTSRT